MNFNHVNEIFTYMQLVNKTSKYANNLKQK